MVYSHLSETKRLINRMSRLRVVRVLRIFRVSDTVQFYGYNSTTSDLSARGRAETGTRTRSYPPPWKRGARQFDRRTDRPAEYGLQDSQEGRDSHVPRSSRHPDSRQSGCHHSASSGHPGCVTALFYQAARYWSDGIPPGRKSATSIFAGHFGICSEAG